LQHTFCRSYYSKEGWTRTDCVAIVTMTIILAATVFKFIFSLNQLPESMSEFGLRVYRLKPLDPVEIENIARTALKRVSVIFLVFLVVNVLMAAGTYKFIGDTADQHGMPRGIRFLVTACTFLTYLATLFPGAPCTAVYLLSFGFGLCSTIVDAYKSQVDAARRKTFHILKRDGKTERREDLRKLLDEEVLSEGDKVAAALEAANKCFGDLAYDEIGASLMFGKNLLFT